MIDITGKRFSRLLVLARGPNKGEAAAWRVRCDCGATSLVVGSNLRRGHTQSCGCLKAERSRAANGIHFESGMRTPEYEAWRNMRSRCYDSTAKGYHNYGGRGIIVCERWRKSYLSFLSDVGRRPSPSHSIDRINNDGNYEPKNCRWATRRQQGLNQRRHLLGNSGASFIKGALSTPWRATFCKKHLGCFATKEQALLAHDTARSEVLL